jgi:hypothetical protein
MSESEIEILKRINREILNLKNINDQRAADEYFYFKVPEIYKEDVAENFNDSNWMHYNLLDSCQKSSFARTMLNLSYDENLTIPNISAMFCPFNTDSLNLNLTLNSSDLSQSASCTDSDEEEFKFNEIVKNEVPEKEYEELLKFKKDMLTVLNIIISTYIVLLASYLLL